MEETISLTTPESVSENALVRYTSEYGLGGCEGFVHPAILFVNGHETPIQVKRFYKESYDEIITSKGFSRDEILNYE